MRFRTRSIRWAFARIDLLAAAIVMALLACSIISVLARSKGKAPRVHCTSSLKQVSLGFLLWASEHEQRYPMAVPIANGGSKEFVDTGPVFHHFMPLSNNIYDFAVLACPSDKGRVAIHGRTNLTDLNVSYFLNMDAEPDVPGSILAGDRNITGGVSRVSNVVVFTRESQAGWSADIHGNHGGNVALADGSVAQVTARGFQQLLAESAVVTNRFMFPVATLDPARHGRMIVLLVSSATLCAIIWLFVVRRRSAATK